MSRQLHCGCRRPSMVSRLSFVFRLASAVVPPSHFPSSTCSMKKNDSIRLSVSALPTIEPPSTIHRVDDRRTDELDKNHTIRLSVSALPTIDPPTIHRVDDRQTDELDKNYPIRRSVSALPTIEPPTIHRVDDRRTDELDKNYPIRLSVSALPTISGGFLPAIFVFLPFFPPFGTSPEEENRVLFLIFSPTVAPSALLAASKVAAAMVCMIFCWRVLLHHTQHARTTITITITAPSPS